MAALAALVTVAAAASLAASVADAREDAPSSEEITKYAFSYMRQLSSQGMSDREIANQLADQAGVAERCDFITGAFPDAVPEGEAPFDACTANGFFDYIEDPAPLITRMRELTKGKLIMSFPKAVEWRVPVRRFRFWFKGTPLFLYRERQVRDILARSGVTDFEWIVLDRDYLVVADV
jgi:hypothetical protein